MCDLTAPPQMNNITVHVVASILPLLFLMIMIRATVLVAGEAGIEQNIYSIFHFYGIVVLLCRSFSQDPSFLESVKQQPSTQDDQEWRDNNLWYSCFSCCCWHSKAVVASLHFMHAFLCSMDHTQQCEILKPANNTASGGRSAC